MILLRELPQFEAICEVASQFPGADPTAIEAFLALLIVENDLSRAHDKQLARHELAHGRWAVLCYLRREGYKIVSPSELAEQGGVSRATITGLLDGLERDGYIRRIEDPEDRRKTGIEVTKVGQAFVDGIFPDHFQWISKLLSGLTPAERKTLVELLIKVQASIRNSEPLLEA